MAHKPKKIVSFGAIFCYFYVVHFGTPACSNEKNLLYISDAALLRNSPEW